MASSLISDSAAWKALEGHISAVNHTHLRDLLADEGRSASLIKDFNGTVVDLSRQRVVKETMDLLLNLATEAKVNEKIGKMFAGERINETENRAVLHVALRAPKDEVITCDGQNVVPAVHEVLDKIKAFSEKVRSGKWVGATGKPLTDVVCIGIGGSFLGPLFVHTALQTEPKCAEAAGKRQLRFLSNVDPIDVALALDGLEPETTLVVIVSKTFTTAETMLNARTVRSWIIAALGKDAVAKHMVAGAWDVDKHFRDASLESNIPVLLGLIGVWNATFLGYPSRAILPYCQSLSKLAPHIQQVSMESNGKGVTIEGLPTPYPTGQIDFGEPGTNGQHSFYQLIHQGRVIPCDFIGIIKSQHSVYLKGEMVSNHDELMCNFFAQADALAYGKTKEQLLSEGVPEALVSHKTFTGNRPSLSILLPTLTPYTVGQLLAMYEHQVAVQGFVWGINSFDQWGVELGKVLALKVRKEVSLSRNKGTKVTAFNYSTNFLLNQYLKEKEEVMKTFD